MFPGVFAPANHKFVVYQLFVRLFGNTKTTCVPYGTIEENGVGKFNDITDVALLALKNFGVTHVWYTGVLEHASVTSYDQFGIPGDDPHLVKGRAGSPYAIRDYYDVCPDLAVDVPERMMEFEALVQRTHAAGLKTIIDFVPNHVARSYHSDVKHGAVVDFGVADDTSKFFDKDNNFIYLHDQPFVIPSTYVPLGGNPLPAYKDYSEFPARVTGNDVYTAAPGETDWFETVKLNFGTDPTTHEGHFDPVPRTWQQHLDILLYWAKKGVDGFRCDMAEMVPAEFWEWVIPCVKTQFPEAIFIAEIYKPEIYERYLETGWFDYLYDKVRLYDTLVGILKGMTHADELTGCARSVEQHPERMLSFLENHDEARLASPGIANDPFDAIPAMTICATLSQGPVMIFNGQEVGEQAVENVGFAGMRDRTSIFDYCGMPAHQRWMNGGRFDGGLLSEDELRLRAFYKEMLFHTTSEAVFRSGKFYDLQWINRHNQSEGFDERFIYAYIRYTDLERVLVVVNFNKAQEYDLFIKIPEDAFDLMGLRKSGVLSFIDLMSDYNSGFVPVADLMKVGVKNGGLHIPMQANTAMLLKFQ